MPCAGPMPRDSRPPWNDFLCTMADGSLLDRAQFISGVAKATKLPSLAAHDVNIRLIGDVAIIHARTTFKLPDGTSEDRPLHRHLGEAGWAVAGGRRARDAEAVRSEARRI